MGRSIEITLAPIIGGLGTLFGPIVGAVVLTGAGRGLHRRSARRCGIPGIKQIFYGLAAAGDRDVPAGRRLAVACRAARPRGARP